MSKETAMNTSARPTQRIVAACVALVATLALGVATMAPAPALAAGVPGSHWALISQPVPTYFHPASVHDFYEVIAVNDGGAETSGEITLTDKLPSGVAATEVKAFAESEYGGFRGASLKVEMTCSIVSATKTVTCTAANGVPAGLTVRAKIDVEVSAGASGTLANEVQIAGGGAATASTVNSTPVTAVSENAPFGASLVSDLVNVGGQADLQAGSHPFAFTTLLAFNATLNKAETCEEFAGCANPVGDPKDIEVPLPAGLVGNPTDVPHCTQAQFHQQGAAQCPADSQVGAMYLHFYGSGTATQYAPVYNIEPPPGQPAELGFSVSTLIHVPMLFHLRSDGEYGLTAQLRELSEDDPVRLAALSIWGVPAEAAHNGMRESFPEHCEGTGCASSATPLPFLTLPTSCPGTGGQASLSLSVRGDSWLAREASPATLATIGLGSIGGCQALSFEPSIEVDPSTTQAGSPAGYDVKLKVPQKEEPEGLATPSVNDVEVALPEGTVISPSSANGLVACSEAQFGLKVEAEGRCSPQARVASVKITTPLLEKPLTGAMYLAEPKCAPCSEAQAGAGEMVRLYIEAAGSGVRIKLAGETKIAQTPGQLDQRTGQLTAVFDGNPQLPFSELEVKVEGGQDAPLANPSGCAATHATAALTPWSSTAAVDIAAPAFTPTGCSSAFAPAFEAGMTGSSRGGSYSPFSVTFRRPPQDQELSGITVSAPAGLLGYVSHVPLCGEAQANAGTCSSASQIGQASADVGPGSAPYLIGGGSVYLTEKYGGGAFGLSIVMPAQAGPFTLAGNAGNGTEVIRAAIDINQKTAAISIVGNPLPRQLDGIPLQIQSVNVTVDRPQFMFNATNCEAKAVTATITSAQGATAAVATPYQPTGCASLPFKPSFSAETHAGHTRRDGAYFKVDVRASEGEANIAEVHVTLPKKLPSRLETLNKSCTEAQFAANPAGCPQAAFVGTATVHTPLLAKALTGPAVFVSHGNAEFPNLDLVLEGEGVRVLLEGNTFIGGKPQVTTSTFSALPDVPISSFDLTLPEQENSALAGEGNLCYATRTTKTRKVVRRKGRVVRRKGRVVHRTVEVKHRRPRVLVMPTTIAGQNGAVVEQQTKVDVAGCGRAKAGGMGKKGKGKKHHHRKHAGRAGAKKHHA
ncbi:MAG: hypothetical protein ACYCUM_10415 [Solirubrobacteraceae bacterium]